MMRFITIPILLIVYSYWVYSSFKKRKDPGSDWFGFCIVFHIIVTIITTIALCQTHWEIMKYVLAGVGGVTYCVWTAFSVIDIVDKKKKAINGFTAGWTVVTAIICLIGFLALNVLYW